MHQKTAFNHPQKALKTTDKIKKCRYQIKFLQISFAILQKRYTFASHLKNKANVYGGCSSAG